MAKKKTYISSSQLYLLKKKKLHHIVREKKHARVLLKEINASYCGRNDHEHYPMFFANSEI